MPSKHQTVAQPTHEGLHLHGTIIGRSRAQVGPQAKTRITYRILAHGRVIEVDRWDEHQPESVGWTGTMPVTARAYITRNGIPQVRFTYGHPLQHDF